MYNARLSGDRLQFFLIAKVAELVDALDLGSSLVRGGSSSLPFRTSIYGHRGDHDGFFN